MRRRAFTALCAVLLLAGCGGRFATDFEPLAPDLAPGWRLADVQATAPQSLTVSVRNLFAPSADIVWYGDPAGDRREQVAAVLEAGIRAGASGLSGNRPVVISATLQRFHAVTPRALSAAPAAVHDIIYTVQVFDADTGLPLTLPQEIQADIEANVGAAAVVASQEGRTQKARITGHIAATTAAWLGIGPDNRRNFVSIGK